MIWTRRIGGALLAFTAAVVWFAMAPDALGPDDHSRELTEILNNADANNALADGAPQQAVVNGWASRDLLALTVEQNDQLSAQARGDQRPAAFLGLITLGIALIVLTTWEQKSRAHLADPVIPRPASVPTDGADQSG